jgi:hypothetical protein
MGLQGDSCDRIDLSTPSNFSDKTIMLADFQISLIRAKRNTSFKLNRRLTQLKTALRFGNVADSYFCPCCGQYTVNWVAWKVQSGKTVCPNCYTQPRHRLFYLYLQEKTNFFRDRLKVLHFAPEQILRKQFSSMPNLDYTTTDLVNPTVDVKMDITNIPYRDNTFDVIFCSHVLEHVMDDRKAMRELFRVLKTDGWAYLQVPLRKKEKTFEDPNIVSPQDRLHYFGQEDHVRFYGFDYKDRLEEAGFKVKIEPYSQKLDAERIKKYGLPDRGDLYFGIK